MNVVIDGVAERMTSRMLSENLEARLDFFCYVQVVANYVQAFDLATTQAFDVIVLPRKQEIDGYSTREFAYTMTHIDGFSASIVPTVDHDSAAHAHGKTVRSTLSSDGYMVDDLVAAIEVAVMKRPPVAAPTSNDNASLQYANKRPRREFAGTSHFPASEPQNQLRPNKYAMHEQDHPRFSSRAEAAAYLHYCQWYQWQQWQLYAQAPNQGQSPHHFFPPAVVMDNSAAIPSFPFHLPGCTAVPQQFHPHHQYALYYNNSHHHTHPFPPPLDHPPSHYPSAYPYPVRHLRQEKLPYYCQNQHHHHQEHHYAHHQQSPRAARPESYSAVATQEKTAYTPGCAPGSSVPAAVPMVSEDVFDDHFDHPSAGLATRGMHLCSAERSDGHDSSSSCTTSDSLDTLSVDCYGVDPIDAEFAACFDVDTWPF